MDELNCQPLIYAFWGVRAGTFCWQTTAGHEDCVPQSSVFTLRPPDFNISVCVQAKQMKSNWWATGVLVGVFFFLHVGQSQACCYPLLPVFILNEANRVLIPALHLTHTLISCKALSVSNVINYLTNV